MKERARKIKVGSCGMAKETVLAWGARSAAHLRASVITFHIWKQA